MRTVLRGLSLAALAGLVFGVGGVRAQQPEGFRVVVHPDNPVTVLTADELSNLYFKRTTRWEDGTRALPVDQPGDSPTREVFSRAVHGRSARAMVAHWQQQIFSGRGVPPTQLADDRAVLEYVAGNRGAVGYVSPGAALRGVKTVEVRR